MKKIYVAGKYTTDTYSGIDDNIKKAENAAIMLWKKGWAVFCPHLNNAHFEMYEEVADLHYQTWIDGTLAFLETVDAIFLLKEWQESKGTVGEYEYSVDHNIHVYYQKHGYPRPWRFEADEKQFARLNMKRLDGVDNGKVNLEVVECVCGYHMGIDATYLDQVSDFRTKCPSCNRVIITDVICPE